MFKEVPRLCARSHLRTHCATVALEGGRRRRSRCGLHCRRFRGCSSEARVTVNADGGNCQKTNNYSDNPGRLIWVTLCQRPERCRVLSGTHDADCAQLAIWPRLRLEGYELIDSRTLTISRECRDVDEYFFVALGGRNEPKTTVIVPLCQSAMRSHQKGLTLELSRTAARHGGVVNATT